MRKSVINYANLRAEMGRSNIGLCELSKIVGVNRDTMARWLSKRTPIPLWAAFNIQEAVATDGTIDWLFEEEV